ncbi:hypothetical protein ACFQY0_03135 [Haloferula chungangensis]|uniref:Cox cluster protein n=1 Tax=Haloferula chungangensis TaxID=1048331 RepID=A0ABW2L1D0_9BACT
MPEKIPDPDAPPSNSEARASPPTHQGRRKVGWILFLTLLALSGLVFYFALFWGWAAGAGSPPHAAQLKAAGHLATGLSGGLFLGAILTLFSACRRR